MKADFMDDLRPNKALGQHFLHDPYVLGKIVAALGPVQRREVLEIGPGMGALTRPLLDEGAHVNVVEKDPRWRALMTEWGATCPVKVVADDALTVRWADVLAPGGLVVGNLPYNVGTEIVAALVGLGVVTAGPRPGRLVFMLQKEVVQRICAVPDTRDWGRLAVLCELLCDREDLFDVPRGAFNPPPKVTSSVVRLTPLPQPRYATDWRRLDVLLRAGFGQRRKMIRGALKGLVSEAQMAAAGVSPTARAETVGARVWAGWSCLGTEGRGT